VEELSLCCVLGDGGGVFVWMGRTERGERKRERERERRDTAVDRCN
jgi:hypothetical protein